MTLTEKQTQELQVAIEQRRAALLGELREDAERVRRDNSEDLAGLEAARTRMTEGGYGVCADCGGDIGYERLRVNPAAVRCIRCQTVHEKTHAAGPGSSL